jgi:molybdopterin-guanine dinucleotide biosynthesis protein A
MIFSDVTGIVLAGGKSTRMGTDKAMLEFKGKPLIQHAVDMLRLVCKEVVISAPPGRYLFTGCDIWPDIVPLQAPMAGIYSCLYRSSNAWNIVLSCDMPLIAPGLLLTLLSHRNDADILIPSHDSDLEPLCAVYNRSLVPALKNSIDNQQFSLIQFVLKSRHKIIEIDQSNPFYRPDLFSNINTTDDFGLLSKS